MGAAAGEIAVERFLHLGSGRRRILLQQRGSAHQDAWDAIAALHGLFGNEGALQRMRPLGAAEPLERRHVLVRDRPQRNVAGTRSATVDNDVASAAFACTAAEMRSNQAELVAQDVKQRTI